MARCGFAVLVKEVVRSLSVTRHRFDCDRQVQTGSSSWTLPDCGTVRSSLVCHGRCIFGLIWCISPLLTTDDAVMKHTLTRRWNGGNKYGALGYACFMMLKL